MRGATLALDASTYTGTVAVIADGRVLAERAVAMRGAHEERLMPAVAEALAESGVGVAGLARVVCGAGPGSFTSLRIAGAIAKGIAASRGLPLHAVPSLWLVVAGARPTLANGTWLAVLDAMRGDVYALPVRVAGALVTPGEGHLLLPRAELPAFAASLGATPVGPDEAASHAPHARGCVSLGTAWPLPPAVDLGAWEPAYGRVAEAQARWEAAHGRPLPA